MIGPSNPAAHSERAGHADPAGYPEIHPAQLARGAGAAEADVETIVFLHGGNAANWMWEPQVKAFRDYQVFTPHLPGFGARAKEDWISLASAADDVAAFIADEIEDTKVHVVGLSLGGVVALRLLAQHPELVASALISGVPADGVHGMSRFAAGLQLSVWDSEWFWRFQAGAFGIPSDSKQVYVEHGLSVRKDNVRKMMAEVYAGGMPEGLSAYTGPLLAVAGTKEPALIRRSFPALAAALPQCQFRVVPGMHHAWNVEDAELFNATVRVWVERGEVLPELVKP